jgi:hypothetical protein
MCAEEEMVFNNKKAKTLKSKRENIKLRINKKEFLVVVVFNFGF